LNLTAGSIVGLAVNIYMLYLLYHGLVEALKAKPDTTKIVMYVLAALLVLFFIIGLGAKRRASKFMDEFKNSDLQEMIENAQKDIEDSVEE